MKLIDKDVLVTEIEKLVSNGKLKCYQSQENNDQVSYTAWSEHIATCGKILSFLDTLEVKEVDLEKEIYDAEKRFGDIDEMGGYRITIFENPNLLIYSEVQFHSGHYQTILLYYFLNKR